MITGFCTFSLKEYLRYKRESVLFNLLSTVCIEAARLCSSHDKNAAAAGIDAGKQGTHHIEKILYTTMIKNGIPATFKPPVSPKEVG